MEWLNSDLKDEIASIFEPKYKRKLTDTELIDIANNLTETLETIFKFKLRKKYGEILPN